MGMDATCDIAYGFVVDKEDLPWHETESQDDAEDWWRKRQGYKVPFELFDDTGNWLPGMQAQKHKVSEYYKHAREWLVANPLPFREVLGNEDKEQVVLALANKVIHLDWDYGVQDIDPNDLLILSDEKHAADALRKFLDDAGIKARRGPGWYGICDYS